MDDEPWFAPNGIDIEHKQFEAKATRDPKVRAAAQAYLKKAIAAYRDVLRLDAGDKVGLIGKDLYPLSSIVQTMRKTQQTALYLERLGPFFVGRAVWQSQV